MPSYFSYDSPVIFRWFCEPMASVLVPKMCYLACPLRQLWHPGGPSIDVGALWSTRRETLGSRQKSFRRFVVICWVILREICWNNGFKSLKAPGNYLDRFWSYKISVLLLQRTKPNISMISGFVNPWSPIFIHFIIPKYFTKSRNHGIWRFWSLEQ